MPKSKKDNKDKEKDKEKEHAGSKEKKKKKNKNKKKTKAAVKAKKVTGGEKKPKETDDGEATDEPQETDEPEETDEPKETDSSDEPVQQEDVKDHNEGIKRLRSSLGPFVRKDAFVLEETSGGDATEANVETPGVASDSTFVPELVPDAAAKPVPKPAARQPSKMYPGKPLRIQKGAVKDASNNDVPQIIEQLQKLGAVYDAMAKQEVHATEDGGDTHVKEKACKPADMHDDVRENVASSTGQAAGSNAPQGLHDMYVRYVDEFDGDDPWDSSLQRMLGDSKPQPQPHSQQQPQPQQVPPPQPKPQQGGAPQKYTYGVDDVTHKACRTDEKGGVEFAVKWKDQTLKSDTDPAYAIFPDVEKCYPTVLMGDLRSWAKGGGAVTTRRSRGETTTSSIFEQIRGDGHKVVVKYMPQKGRTGITVLFVYPPDAGKKGKHSFRCQCTDTAAGSKDL